MDHLNLSSIIQHWDVSRLIPYERNARVHSDEQVGQVAASIEQFGFTNPILVASDDGIIAGHCRLAAAKSLGLAQVPVIVLDHLTPAQRRAYTLADNKLALNASWDEELLARELAELQAEEFDLAVIGFSDDELAGLLDDEGLADAGEGLTDPDDVPEVEEQPVTRPGDVWVLGQHRVMCGSALVKGDMDVLLHGKRADMVFTDPPYLMNFLGAIDGDGNTRSEHDPITNDNLGKREGDAFLRDMAASVRQWCAGSWYICFHRLGIDRLMLALTAGGLKWRNLIIWKKEHLNLSNSDYKSIYEPIVYGWVEDYVPVLYGWNHKHEFRGPKGAVDVLQVAVPSVWEINRTRKNDLHPTMKPVALCEAAIQNSSRTGQVVLDLFGGSGSTLIACEQLQRRGRVMELEPKYCDVIVRRWQAFTGRMAVLEATGERFEEKRHGASTVHAD